jgi:hypothetical protein
MEYARQRNSRKDRQQRGQELRTKAPVAKTPSTRGPISSTPSSGRLYRRSQIRPAQVEFKNERDGNESRSHLDARDITPHKFGDFERQFRLRNRLTGALVIRGQDLAIVLVEVSAS